MQNAKTKHENKMMYRFVKIVVWTICRCSLWAHLEANKQKMRARESDFYTYILYGLCPAPLLSMRKLLHIISVVFEFFKRIYAAATLSHSLTHKPRTCWKEQTTHTLTHTQTLYFPSSCSFRRLLKMHVDKFKYQKTNEMKLWHHGKNEQEQV